MKFNRLLALSLFILFTGCNRPSNVEDGKWVAMHFLNYNTDADLNKLAAQLPGLASMGVNTAILEVDYNFRYTSHPELSQSQDAVTARAASDFSEACRRSGMQLWIEFQCLGHQSWAKETYALLTAYPELDLTPGAFPGNEGLYCREWDPTNPKVNEIVFALLDDLIDAFKPEGIHVGMDEVFLLGSEKSPNTLGKNPASLYARVVNELHGHIVKKHGLKMMMWGDRLIDSKVYPYGDWEASSNGTAPAIDSIPRDIIIADWHYELRDDYPSVRMFIDKGFRVLPTTWRNVEASHAFIGKSLALNSPGVLGFLCSAWDRYPDPAQWPPLVDGLKLLNPQ